MRLIVCEISLKRHGRVVNRQKAAVHRRRRNGRGRIGGAQAETEWVADWRCTGGDKYILSVRLNQAAGFIIYRLKFIFRPGKRRRTAAELPGRISGCIAYRDVCRTGRLAVPGPVLHRDICHTGICAAPGYVLYWDVCSTGARVVLCRRGAVLFRGRNAVLCRDGWKCVLFIF